MSENKLFRESAQNTYQFRLYGDVSQVSRSHTPILLLLLISMGLFICLLIFSEFTLVQKVSGWVESEGGTIEVRAVDGGVTRSISSSVGSSVFSGDLLLHLERVKSGSQGEDAYSDIENNLREKEQHSLAQMRFEVQAMVERLDGVSKAYDREVEIASSIKRQEQILKIKLKNVEDTVSKYQISVDRGLLAAVRLNEITDKKLLAELELESVKERYQSSQSRLIELTTEIHALELSIASLKSAYEAKKIDNLNEIIKTRSEKYETVISPIDGKLVQLSVKNGMFVKPGETVAFIRSVKMYTRAHLLVPYRSFGFVETGARVVLKLDAYPYTKYGSLSGRVAEVRDMLLPAGVGHDLPNFSNANYYVVVAEIERDDANPALNDVELINGMKLSAEIVLEKHRIMTWLLHSLYEGFRGPN